MVRVKISPCAVVPGQGHRVRRGQRRRPRLSIASRGPGTLTVPGIGGDPAEFGEIGVRRSGRRQQHDLRALRIDRLVIGGERQIVDAGAGQIDRAVQSRRVDLDARLLGDGRGARLPRRCAATAPGAAAPAAPAVAPGAPGWEAGAVAVVATFGAGGGCSRSNTNWKPIRIPTESTIAIKRLRCSILIGASAAQLVARACRRSAGLPPGSGGTGS